MAQQNCSSRPTIDPLRITKRTPADGSADARVPQAFPLSPTTRTASARPRISKVQHPHRKHTYQGLISFSAGSKPLSYAILNFQLVKLSLIVMTMFPSPKPSLQPCKPKSPYVCPHVVEQRAHTAALVDPEHPTTHHPFLGLAMDTRRTMGALAATPLLSLLLQLSQHFRTN